MNPPPATESAAPERKGALIQSTGWDYREIALRVALVVLNLGSIGLLWWSVQKQLLPLMCRTLSQGPASSTPLSQ